MFQVQSHFPWQRRPSMPKLMADGIHRLEREQRCVPDSSQCPCIGGAGEQHTLSVHLNSPTNIRVSVVWTCNCFPSKDRRYSMALLFSMTGSTQALEPTTPIASIRRRRRHFILMSTNAGFPEASERGRWRGWDLANRCQRQVPQLSPLTSLLSLTP